MYYLILKKANTQDKLLINEKSFNNMLTIKSINALFRVKLQEMIQQLS
jgi:hypothetical protein